jgi:hypothetical protein
MNYYRALELVEELTDLIEGNEYQSFFVSHLLSIQYEILRQISCVKQNS